MTTYKGYYIWHNSLQGWMIQIGYEVVHVSPSLSEAKRYISRYLGPYPNGAGRAT